MPHVTVDPELELPTPAAEVVVVYAGRVFDVRHFERGAYTVGDAPQASFPLLSAVLPDPDRFPLIGCHAGAIALRFTADMRGELAEDHASSSLAALIASGRATPIDGAFTLALAPGSRAVVHIDAVRFELRNVPAARPIVHSGRFRWDWWPHALAIFVLLATLLLIAQRQPAIPDSQELDEWPEAMHFVGYFNRPPAAEAVRDRVTLPRSRPPANPLPLHADEAGALGKPSSRAKHRQFAVAELEPPTRPHTEHFNPDPDPQQGGLLGLQWSCRGSYLTSRYVWRERASDRSERDRWGRSGRREGEAYGIGGLGFTGTGRGAGGWRIEGTVGGAGTDLAGFRRRHAGRTRREPGVISPLTLADVRRILAWRSAALRRCDPRGAVTLRFTISGVGQVRDLERPHDDAATRCVADQIQRMWFPRGVGSLRVDYPLPPAP